MPEIVNINTKYRTVDRKIKSVVVPLPKDSCQKMKEVSNDSILRDPKAIGHVFTDERKGKLRVGKEDFLLLEEEQMFLEMLERHGKSFAFSPQEIGCADPRTIELMVIFTVPTRSRSQVEGSRINGRIRNFPFDFSTLLVILQNTMIPISYTLKYTMKKYENPFFGILK